MLMFLDPSLRFVSAVPPSAVYHPSPIDQVYEHGPGAKSRVPGSLILKRYMVVCPECCTFALHR